MFTVPHCPTYFTALYFTVPQCTTYWTALYFTVHSYFDPLYQTVHSHCTPLYPTEQHCTPLDIVWHLLDIHTTSLLNHCTYSVQSNCVPIYPTERRRSPLNSTVPQCTFFIFKNVLFIFGINGVFVLTLWAIDSEGKEHCCFPPDPDLTIYIENFLFLYQIWHIWKFFFLLYI